jgi:SAM-dependent methyltransferase
MQSPSDEPDDKSWLRVPLTDPVAVAERYDEWASSYDEELNAWGYEAPVQAARLLTAQLRAHDVQDGVQDGAQDHGRGGAQDGARDHGRGGAQDDVQLRAQPKVDGQGEATGQAQGKAQSGHVDANDANGADGADGATVEGAVLDIGCGTGLTGLALHTLGVHIIDGLDLSEASLAAAQSRGIYRSLRRHNFNESALPFADNSYRAAECVGVMSYARDPRALIVDACRVVQPGGCVVFSQRNDLWDQHNLAEVLNDLCAEGILTKATWSEPQPYMPGNADFADQILVLYATLTVA